MRGVLFGLEEAAVKILSRDRRALTIYQLLLEPEGCQS